MMMMMTTRRAEESIADDDCAGSGNGGSGGGGGGDFGSVFFLSLVLLVDGVDPIESVGKTGACISTEPHFKKRPIGWTRVIGYVTMMTYMLMATNLMHAVRRQNKAVYSTKAKPSLILGAVTRIFNSCLLFLQIWPAAAHSTWHVVLASFCCSSCYEIRSRWSRVVSHARVPFPGEATTIFELFLRVSWTMGAIRENSVV